MKKIILIIFVLIVLSSFASAYVTKSTERTDYYLNGSIYLADGVEVADLGLDGNAPSNGDYLKDFGWSIAGQALGRMEYNDTYASLGILSMMTNTSSANSGAGFYIDNATFNGTIGIKIYDDGTASPDYYFKWEWKGNLEFNEFSVGASGDTTRWKWREQSAYTSCDLVDAPRATGNWTEIIIAYNTTGKVNTYINNQPCHQFTNDGGILSISFGSVLNYKVWFDEFFVATGDIPPPGVPGVPATPVFVAPSPANNAHNNTNVTFNLTQSDTDVQWYFWVDDNAYSFNVTGSVGHFNFTTNLTDGEYTISVSVQNTTSGVFSSNATRTWIVDTVSPTISILQNTTFETDNTTIISNYLHNLSINISFFDSFLFQTLINITNESDESVFQILNTSITGTTANYSRIVNLTHLAVGNYTIKLSATDSHTAKEIGDYDVKNGLDYFRYTTDEGNVIKIKSNNINLFTKSTIKLIDRYDFEFNFLFQQDTYTFRIESYNKIEYLKDSKATVGPHFVIMSGSGKGNWIDFENPNLNAKDYNVTKIDDYIYEIEITANGLKSFTFNSLGGLNTVEEHYLLRIGSVIDVWVFDEENHPVQINATVTIEVQSANSTINLSGARLENITKEITSLSLTSEGFGTEKKTISITQTFHNFSFNMTSISSTRIFFFDETSGALIGGETFTVFLETTGFTDTFSTTSNPHIRTGLQNGLYKIKASSSNYPERQLVDVNVSNTTTTIVNIYLINETLGFEKTFNIVSTDGLAPIENVRSVFTRTVNVTKQIIAEETSDFAGQIVLDLDSNVPYTINFSHVNFEDRTIILEPKLSSYVIQMVSTVGAYNQSVHEGIRYRFDPSNTVLNNDTEYNFTFTLNSTIWPLTNCTLRLFNGTILMNETSSFTSTSCFISIGRNTSSMTDITAQGIYELDSQFEFTVSQNYKVIFTYVGQFSLKNFLDDLSGFAMAGFDDFGRMILALIVIFIITAFAAQKTGFTNPEVLIFLVIAQVWLFSSVNWLFLDFAPIPTVAGFDLKKYIIAILVTMAGGAFVMKKFTE